MTVTEKPVSEKEVQMLYPGNYGGLKKRCNQLQPHLPIQMIGDWESMRWVEQQLHSSHERRKSVDDARDELAELIGWLEGGRCPLSPEDHARRFLNRLKDIHHLLKENH